MSLHSNPLHRIGYACVAAGVPRSGMKSCTRLHATKERLHELIQINLNTLERLIDYNISRNIRLFRISSDLIPYGSSAVNLIPWWKIYADRFRRIGKKINSSQMRVSMHPGQYTVLNSPDVSVRDNAVEDLVYHTRVLDALTLDLSHRLVIHIGGAYGDKVRSAERFIEQIGDLSDVIRRRIVVENDEKSYHIGDVLEIATKSALPVVFDVFHHQLNPPNESADTREWIIRCAETWKSQDGRQKIHYSQPRTERKDGSHSQTIRLESFVDFFQSVSDLPLDIMLEVKDKDLSVVKCLCATAASRSITHLEEEWSRYKYRVLEISPAAYQRIRGLLKNKAGYPVYEFFHMIDSIQNLKPEPAKCVNAAAHVWGYFKNRASDDEKALFQQKVKRMSEGKTGNIPVKAFLYDLSVKYECAYLLDSYYFSELR